VLSAKEQKELRQAGRDWLCASAAEQGPDSHPAHLLRLEAACRDGEAAEPEMLKCQSIAAALFRAAP